MAKEVVRVFRRIAILNRGEAAMRLIHAVRDLNLGGEGPVEAVALFTNSESNAMFVREADMAFSLGPASARPYLDLAVLERALCEIGADAVWPGWGFLAEDPAFVDLCERLGVTFIGPSAEAMRRLGDKVGSKLIAEEVGVPVAPWSRGAVASLEDALSAAGSIGYPLMLKAAAGGGGRGIRMVDSAAALEAAFHRTKDEAERAFGSGVVFLERLVTGARHVEVQLIVDGHGTAWALGVRDCSVQRRHQKVIEESASPLLSQQQNDELKVAAERLALSVGYVGAGTVEFLYHPQEKTFAFLEVNTRLQVEHSITEATTGIDLVKAQIHVAAGGRLEGERPAEVGHAVEARLNAEDPDRDFTPAPGRIVRLDLPMGPGVRVDTGVAEGDTIPPHFDSMIAKIIAHGRTREEALARLRRALSETTVVVAGGASNKSFVLDLLKQPEIVDGTGGWADTSWIDRVRAEGRLVVEAHSGVALVAAAIEAYREEARIEIAHLLETAHDGRPQVLHEVGRSVELRLRGTTYLVTTFNTGPMRYAVTVAHQGVERTVDVELEPVDDFHRRLVVSGTRYRVVTATHGSTTLVEVDGVAHHVSRAEGGLLCSPAPALVVNRLVGVGEVVEAGAPVMVLESMKMETVLRAPFPALVKALMANTGNQVDAGTPLVKLEPVGDGVEDVAVSQDGVPGLDLPEPSKEPSSQCKATWVRANLAAVLLGYDLTPQLECGALARYREVREELRGAGVPVVADEIALLGIFADLAELARNRPADEEPHTEMRVHSPREHFYTYLQSLDVDRAELPEQFRGQLLAVLRHFGVTGLERTSELEEAIFRIFLVQKGSATEVQVATEVLQHWISEPPPTGDLAVAARELLERLGRAIQLRLPVVGDLVRSVRFRWFVQPLIDAERINVLAGVRDEIEALAANGVGPDRDERIEALAAIPEQIVRLFAERLERGMSRQEPMLEVLARRHYREFDLHDLRTLDVDERPFVVADYTLDERPTRLVSTVGTHAELADPDSTLAASVRAQVADRRPGDEAVVDLCVHWAGAPRAADEASEQLCRLVGLLPFARDIRRVALAVCSGAERPVGYFTFRPTPDGGVAEDCLVRGVHPMVGRRLNLWRLSNFHVQRIEAPEDVLLYECAAIDNTDDRRLVALAQVSQLAVVRDELGTVIGHPHAERAVEHCLEVIRGARVARSSHDAKLDIYHVWLHHWPVVDIDAQGLTTLQHTFRPLTDGGIEEVRAPGSVVGPNGALVPSTLRFSAQPGAGVVSSLHESPTTPLMPVDAYAGKVRARRRGLVYPYELMSLLSGGEGTLVEHDLDDSGMLVPVDRSPALNESGIIAAVVTTPTPLHPEGVTRVVLCGDATKSLGSVSEPECTRVIAAIELAERMQVPVEWFALSAGARISMDSGTENMDWVAAALRRIIEFTQAGGEVNVVVAGINVGAQPYWNAEATMLMHTKGILVMTPESAMVLTGKQPLDFSGGVSAEDNMGIGGFDRVMGPNGQAQYWAPNLSSAFDILMAHYAHAYVVPGEACPRRAATTDPIERDITPFPHEVAGSDFATVGEIFSSETNPDRKKAFDIRTVMRAVADQDHATLDRWTDGPMGRHGRRRDGGRPRRAAGRLPRLPARHRVTAGSATWLPARRRSGHLHGGDPVPAVVEEGGTGHQRGEREPADGRAGEPVGVRRLA